MSRLQVCIVSGIVAVAMLFGGAEAVQAASPPAVVIGAGIIPDWQYFSLDGWFSTLLGRRAINPQPLPPGGRARSINPQPLPPG